jgi:hypothetical protein
MPSTAPHRCVTRLFCLFSPIATQPPHHPQKIGLVAFAAAQSSDLDSILPNDLVDALEPVNANDMARSLLQAIAPAGTPGSYGTPDVDLTGVAPTPIPVTTSPPGSVSGAAAATTSFALLGAALLGALAL